MEGIVPRTWAAKLVAAPTQDEFDKLLEEGVRHWLTMRAEAKRPSVPEGHILKFRSADDIRAKLAREAK